MICVNKCGPNILMYITQTHCSRIQFIKDIRLWPSIERFNESDNIYWIPIQSSLTVPRYIMSIASLARTKPYLLSFIFRCFSLKSFVVGLRGANWWTVDIRIAFPDCWGSWESEIHWKITYVNSASSRKYRLCDYLWRCWSFLKNIDSLVLYWRAHPPVIGSELMFMSSKMQVLKRKRKIVTYEKGHSIFYYPYFYPIGSFL